MTIEINYGQRQYIISADGYLLGHAESYEDAYAIEAAYLEAKHSAAMGGDPLLIEVARFAQAGREQPFCFFCISADHDTKNCPKLDNGQADRVCEGLEHPCAHAVAFAVPLHLGHAIDGAPVTTTMHLCSDCYTRWQSWQADRPTDNIEAQPCNPPDTMCSVDDPCPAHAAEAQAWHEQNDAEYLDVDGMRVVGPWAAETPLLALCAAVIRRCLGRTTGARGIVDELRRVEQKLTEEGW